MVGSHIAFLVLNSYICVETFMTIMALLFIFFLIYSNIQNRQKQNIRFLFSMSISGNWDIKWRRTKRKHIKVGLRPLSFHEPHWQLNMLCDLQSPLPVCCYPSKAVIRYPKLLVLQSIKCTKFYVKSVNAPV